MVLDRVVGAAGQQLGDLRPPVAHLHVALEQDAVLLLAPGVSGQAVVDLVVPPLAALLALPPGHVLRDLRPLLCTVLLDERTEPPVLLVRPGLAVVLRLGVVLPARRVDRHQIVLVWLFLHFEFKYDLCPLADDHVTAALHAGAAPPTVLADAAATALLAVGAPPPVLTDAFAAALLAPAALPPVLAKAAAAALFAPIAPPTVRAGHLVSRPSALALGAPRNTSLGC